MDWSYTQRRKPAEGGDRGSDDRKKTRGEETIGYAERVSERIVICGTKNKGGKQELVENMEAKNLPNGRPLTTTRVSMTVGCHKITTRSSGNESGTVWSPTIRAQHTLRLFNSRKAGFVQAVVDKVVDGNVTCCAAETISHSNQANKRAALSFAWRSRKVQCL